MMTRIGNVVEFERFGKTVRGVVVSEQVYPWCHGADDISVYVRDGVVVCQMYPYQAKTVETGADVKAEADHYLAHLNTYPAWQKQIAEGWRPAEFGIRFTGFSGIEKIS